MTSLEHRIQYLTSSGYDATLAGLSVLEAGGGRARARLVVSEGVQNVNGTLHGGAIATLVDVVGTLAIVSGDRDGRAGVSTDLNVSFFAAAKVGEPIVIEGAVLKHGRTLAFVSVDLRRERDGALLAQGRMTKHLGEATAK